MQQQPQDEPAAPERPASADALEHGGTEVEGVQASPPTRVISGMLAAMFVAALVMTLAVERLEYAVLQIPGIVLLIVMFTIVAMGRGPRAWSRPMSLERTTTSAGVVGRILHGMAAILGVMLAADRIALLSEPGRLAEQGGAAVMTILEVAALTFGVVWEGAVAVRGRAPSWGFVGQRNTDAHDMR